MKETIKVYRVQFIGPYDRKVFVELPIICFGKKKQDQAIADKEIRYFMNTCLATYCDIDEGYTVLAVSDYEE